MPKISGTVVRSGRLWQVREAASMRHVEGTISHAQVFGSVGEKLTIDQTLVGGSVIVLADVVQLNSDGTERQPYQEAY